jgi:hypothetical protein
MSDKWIEQLKACKYLPENDLKNLCKLVSARVLCLSFLGSFVRTVLCICSRVCVCLRMVQLCVYVCVCERESECVCVCVLCYALLNESLHLAPALPRLPHAQVKEILLEEVSY